MATGTDPYLPTLNPLFQKMVAKRPEDRHQSVSELLADIQSTRERLDQPVEDIPIETVRDGISFVDRKDSPTMMPTSSPSANIAGSSPSNSSGSSISKDQPTVAMSSPQLSSTPSGYVPAAGVGMPQGVSNPAFIGLKHHRGKTIITLGLISFFTSGCFIGALLGGVTWIYANSDLKEMKSGLRDANGRNLTLIGKILAIVAVVIGGFSMIGMLLGSLFG